MEKKYFAYRVLLALAFSNTIAIDEIDETEPNKVELGPDIRALFNKDSGLKLHSFAQDGNTLIWGYTSDGAHWVSCLHDAAKDKFTCKLDRHLINSDGTNAKQSWRILESERLFRRLDKEYIKRSSKL